jgi:serine/threonine protein kinase/tetratricopeptide (TPR) repeat protein
MPAELSNLEAAFSEALELPEGPDRAAYLDQACGDDAELRRQVESLLALHGHAGRFLETPTLSRDTRPCESVGAVIGPYKLMKQIGEGGMGVVYAAEQHQPVRRKVALKIIKPGMDSKQVIARFEAERQALAMMDHPNIAKVHDGGTTDSGRPYFVMELVRGIPITEYCDRERLSVPERLDLFVLVCRAVQHAHQKGVIHRDLKPSNVLVTVIDGVGVPKVIDFGVAKATGQALTEKTLFTGFHQFVGTPLYTSPEQAELSGVDVDTRSDIYSLGVLLYELLTGTTPFDPETLRRAAFDEMRRIIREEEPPKPSTRLGTLGDRLTTVSANRRADPRHLMRALEGELDWIVMKAVEKERHRRYDTANSLANDVRRYLDDEPVQACPPSRSYCFRKFARRHRGALLASAAVVAVLLAATGVSTWQTARILGAYSRLRTEQRRTQAALVAEAKRRQEARQALDTMSSKIVGEWLSKQPVLLPEHKRFLEQALAWYEEFAAETGQDEAARAGLAGAYYRVGSIRHLLGQRDEAEAAYRKCLTIQEPLVRDFPDVIGYAVGLGDTYRYLGGLERDRTRPRAALPWFEKEVQEMESLARLHPGLLQPRVHVAEGYHYLGLCWADLGRTREAESAYRKAFPLLEQLVAEFPDEAECAADLSHTYSCLGSLERDQGRSAVALTWYEKAIRTLEPVARRHPELPSARSDLGDNLNNRANSLRDLGRRAESEAAYKQAVGVLERLAGEFPTRLIYCQPLALANCNLGDLLVEGGRLDEAEAAFQKAQALLEQLARESPGVSNYPVDLGMTYYGFGMLAEARGRPAEALPWIDRAVALLGPVVERQPDLRKARHILLVVYCGRAQALAELGRQAEALRSWDQAIALVAGPMPDRIRLARASTLAHLGQYAKATAEADELSKPTQVGAGDLYNLACVYALSSAAAEGEPALEERYAAHAVELLRQAAEKGYRDVAHLEKDADLDPIRGRPDFQLLIMDLAFPADPFAR